MKRCRGSRSHAEENCLQYAESEGGYGKDTGDAGSPAGGSGSSLKRRGRLRHGAAHDADRAQHQAMPCQETSGGGQMLPARARWRAVADKQQQDRAVAGQHRDVADRAASQPGGLGGWAVGGGLFWKEDQWDHGWRLGRCQSCAASSSPHAQAFEANRERGRGGGGRMGSHAETVRKRWRAAGEGAGGGCGAVRCLPACLLACLLAAGH